MLTASTRWRRQRRSPRGNVSSFQCHPEFLFFHCDCDCASAPAIDEPVKKGALFVRGRNSGSSIQIVLRHWRGARDGTVVDPQARRMGPFGSQ